LIVHFMRSSVNFLGTSTSDVDICITTPSKKLENILTLSKKLQKHEMKVVKCVPKAKVPIVKFWDPTLKLACDINVNNAQALYNTNLIKSYVCLDSRVHPLVMIIKHWVQRRDLNNAAYGTIIIYLDMYDFEFPSNTLSSNFIKEPFNPERNLGNGVNNDRFKKIIQEFRRVVEYLYNANLELCCEIYDEYEYDEFEYVAGIPLITLKALLKANL
ncbi:2171_t:CDS:2, partial [Racocetra persica]